MHFRITNSLRLASVIATVHLVALFVLPRGPSQSLLSDVSQLLASALAVSACWSAARRSKGAVRRLLRSLGTSFALWSFAQLLWLLAEYVFGKPVPTPSAIHLLYFFAFAPLAVALLDYKREPGAFHRGQLLDFFQVTIVLLTTYYYIFFVPHVLQDEVGRTFAYTLNVRNLLIFAGLALRAVVERRSEVRRLLLAFGASWLAYSGANAAATYRVIWCGVPATGTWHDLAWSLPFLGCAVAASFWKRTEADRSADDELPHLQRSVLVVNLLPLVIPVLILTLSSKIAMSDLGIAALATAASFLCYGLRTAFIQRRQQDTVHELKATRERFQLLFTRHPQPMFVFDAETHAFVEVNDAALQTYGYSREEFLGLRATDIRPAEDVADFVRRLTSVSGPTRLSHRRHKLKSGRLIYVDVTAERLDFAGRKAVLAVAHDVTDKYFLEDRLRQSQKMEAVGTLAGGVAHDFNNLLTVIKGYSSLLLDSAQEDSETSRQIIEIDKAATRASALTRQLLAFSRKQVFHLQVLNLNQVVENVSSMLERLIGEHIDVVRQFSADLRQVKADPTQLDQVIINLAVNARDAMPGGGRLTFRTENVRIEGGMDFPRYSVPAGDYVCLKVSDTGMGMDEATQAHIFEPFFTTKEQGKGTGLGLSTVYGIIKQSEGFIQVESDLGQGTTFSILLPCVNDPVAAVRPVNAASAAPTPSKTVLLAEEDEAVRHFARKVLREHGFMVMEVSDGQQAETLCEVYSGSIDVLLTDAVMPGMNGYQLGDRITQLRPKIKVVVMSGYGQEFNAEAESRFLLLQKPFTPDSLIQAILTVLGPGSSRVSA